LGNSYEVPIYCIVQPTNLVDQDGTMQAAARTEQDSGIDTNITSLPPSDSTDNPYSIIVRLSTNHDLTIKINSKQETVGSLRSRIFDTLDTDINSQTHSLRLIYLGKVLTDSTRIICLEDSESSPTSTQDAIQVCNNKSVVQALMSKRG
jgi:hypothetical protein